MGRPWGLAWVVGAIVAVAGCGGGSSGETTGPEGEGGGAGGETPPDDGGEGGGEGPDFAGRMITIEVGFVPDPRVVEGEAVGNVDAATLGPDCVGFLGDEPDHTLVLGTEIEQLHLMASSSMDVTLVVRRPDGTVICNDDFQETHPKVTLAPAVAGTYQVWVGNYEEGGRPSPYHLGVTTLGTVTPSMLNPGEEEAPLDLGEGEDEVVP